MTRELMASLSKEHEFEQKLQEMVKDRESLLAQSHGTKRVRHN